MLHNKVSVRKTKSGKVFKVVREHYLRDDIWCGVVKCTVCSSSISSPPILHLNDDSPVQFFSILHTSVILHQIDLLENKAIQNCIILQTVLEQVKKSSMHIYNRIKTIISTKDRQFYLFSNEYNKDTYEERLPSETPENYQIRLIVKAYQWYKTHLINSAVEVKLIINTEEDAPEALKNFDIIDVDNYVEYFVNSNPEVVDLVVKEVTDKEDKLSYEDYKTTSEVEQGIVSKLFFQGKLGMNPTNCHEGYVRRQDDDGEIEILISGMMNLNRSIEGDIVVVELLPKDKWITPSSLLVENDINEIKEDGTAMEIEEKKRLKEIEREKYLKPTGKVVAIAKRNWKPLTGSLLPIDDRKLSQTTTQFLLFLPTDRRIPKIRIRTRQASTLLNKLIVVSIDNWSKSSLYPQGHFVKILGDCGDKDSESEALLIQYDITYHPFSENVLKCLPQLPWEITEDDLKQRKDLRHLLVASIDPPGCTDIDDALHIRDLENGNFEVGVHIADVTHFVKPNTAMDEEASQRASTVYLADRRIDMLPKLLGENLCSLRSNVDRFAFSVIWEMNENAEIVSVDFTKSIILSKASLTYGEAQLRIDDPLMNDPLTKNLRILNKLAKIIRSRRVSRGTLTLANPEVRFKLSEDRGDPIDGPELYQMKETNSLVEEFMLLANISVAKKIYQHFPHFSVLRRHPSPPSKNFETLLNSAKLKNVDIDVSSSLTLSNSLENAKFNDHYLNTLLRIITTRCMLQAQYFCSGTLSYDEFHHYGLAEDIYTHFTSPIRRYADVLVHRLLAASLGIASETTNYTVNSIKHICDNMNHRHRMAQQASRDSNELFTIIFFRDKVVEEKGYVTRIKANAFIVLIPKFGIEGIVYVASTESTSNDYTYNEECQYLENTKANFKISLFDKITAKIFVDYSTNRPRLRLQSISPLIPLFFTPKLSQGLTLNQISSSPASDAKKRKNDNNQNNNKKKKKLKN